MLIEVLLVLVPAVILVALVRAAVALKLILAVVVLTAVVVVAAVRASVRVLELSRSQCRCVSVGMSPVSRCRWKPRLIASPSRRRGVRDEHRGQGESGEESEVKLVAQQDVFFFFVHCSRCSATPSPPPPASTDRAEPILRRVTLTHAHTHTPPSYVNTRLCTGVREMDR